MTSPTPRRNWTPVLLVLAIAAVVFVAFRVYNTAQEHRTPVSAGQPMR